MNKQKLYSDFVHVQVNDTRACDRCRHEIVGNYQLLSATGRAISRHFQAKFRGDFARSFRREIVKVYIYL